MLVLMWIIMGYWTTGCSLNKNSLFPSCLFASGGFVGYFHHTLQLLPMLMVGEDFFSAKLRLWCLDIWKLKNDDSLGAFLVDPYLCRTCSARVAWHIYSHIVLLYTSLTKKPSSTNRGNTRSVTSRKTQPMFSCETLSEHHNFRKQRPHIIMRILTTPQRYPSQKSFSFMGYYPPFSWKSRLYMFNSLKLFRLDIKTYIDRPAGPQLLVHHHHLNFKIFQSQNNMPSIRTFRSAKRSKLARCTMDVMLEIFVFCASVVPSSFKSKMDLGLVWKFPYLSEHLAPKQNSFSSESAQRGTPKKKNFSPTNQNPTV